MHRLSKKALRLRSAWKLKDVALNKLRVRRRSYKEHHRGRVTNNSWALVYLRSFSTRERSNTNFDPSLFLFLLSLTPFSLSPSPSPCFCARFEFHNVIYGAWRNSFRFLGLSAAEFTTPDVLTSSFFPLTPGPRRPPLSPLFPGMGSHARSQGCPRLSSLARKKGATGAHTCVHIYLARRS